MAAAGQAVSRDPCEARSAFPGAGSSRQRGLRRPCRPWEGPWDPRRSCGALAPGAARPSRGSPGPAGGASRGGWAWCRACLWGGGAWRCPGYRRCVPGVPWRGHGPWCACCWTRCAHDTGCPRCPVLRGVGLVPDAHVAPVLGTVCGGAGSARGRCAVASEWYLVWADDSRCAMQCVLGVPVLAPMGCLCAQSRRPGSLFKMVPEGSRGPSDSQRFRQTWVLGSASPRSWASSCELCLWRQEPA